MRNLAALIITLLLLLTGCAKDLPYAFSIDPSGAARGCAVSLHQVLKDVKTKFDLENRSAEGKWTIRGVQEAFEMMLGDRVQYLACAKPNQLLDFGAPTVEPVEDVSSKWLTTYAFEPSDTDHNMDRFIEFLLSMRVVQVVTEKPLNADIKHDYDPLFEESSDKRAQWFGEQGGQPREDCPTCSTFLQGVNQLVPQAVQNLLPPPAQTVTAGVKGCADCSLYKIFTNPQNLYPSKDYPQNQSDPTKAGVLLTVARKIISDKDRSRRIMVLGYEIPWDEDRTLIRYGVTLYFEDSNDAANGNRHLTHYLGYDLVYANEATPAPYEPVQFGDDGKLLNEVKNYRRPVSWPKHIWYATSYPFSLAIGIKNAAFELAKMPFSLIAGALFGRDSAMHYPLQNFRMAYNAVYFEATSETRIGMPLSVYRLFTEIPLIGHLFQYNFGAEPPVDASPSDNQPATLKPARRNKIFLSRGIYGGNKWGQDTGLWAATARWAYPDYDIYSPPYRHGTVTDVVWSMFNL